MRAQISDDCGLTAVIHATFSGFIYLFLTFYRLVIMWLFWFAMLQTHYRNDGKGFVYDVLVILFPLSVSVFVFKI